MSDDKRLAQLLDDQFAEQGSARNPFAPFAAGTDLNHLSLRGNFNLIEVAEAVHAAGWRPPAQVITNSDDMDALPWGSVVLAYGVAHQACPAEFGGLPVWLKPTGLRAQTSAELLADCRGAGVTVLYVPGDAE